ncbi:MAG: TetR family transcriptional regulator [Proteobacteria bacterium]|nr:TetR family transcriptional regulator [Pseudomonadota bacterium]
MQKSSPELTEARRNEIIEACQKLYETKSFREITIKDIGAVTSFTRTSIYNYFETKEEIFLAMHQQEYELWCEALQHIMDDNKRMSKEQFAEALAKSLENRDLLLKLMSMNHYDMEGNSRPEMLYAFKVAYGQSLKMVEACLRKFFPKFSDERIHEFIYVFFPFMFGIYPYTKVTEKQKEAMKQAGIQFDYQTIYSISKRCILALLV